MQIFIHIFDMYREDCTEKNSPKPRGGVDGQIQVAERQASSRCNGPGMKDFQFGQQHDDDATDRLTSTSPAALFSVTHRREKMGVHQENRSDKRSATEPDRPRCLQRQW